MSNLKEELREILKEFLDATDYALEAPEEQADDKDWFDRPYNEALEAILSTISKHLPEKRNTYSADPDMASYGLGVDDGFDQAIDEVNRVLTTTNKKKGEV